MYNNKAVVKIEENDEGEAFINLPKEFLNELNWKEDDVLEWKLENGKVIIQKASK